VWWSEQFIHPGTFGLWIQNKQQVLPPHEYERDIYKDEAAEMRRRNGGDILALGSAPMALAHLLGSRVLIGAGAHPEHVQSLSLEFANRVLAAGRIPLEGPFSNRDARPESDRRRLNAPPTFGPAAMKAIFSDE
jgi:hypothetical protein